MKMFLAVLAFVVFSFVLVQTVPAAPPPPGAPVGGHIPSGVAIGFIAVYGVWRMRGK